MVDLGDGFGPFVPRTISVGNSIDPFKETNISTYSEAIESKAHDEYNSIREKTHEISKLKSEASELECKIKRSYTKSTNPKVRAKMKANRDAYQARLTKIMDELKDYEVRKK